jgi:hypothetical protein
MQVQLLALTVQINEQWGSAVVENEFSGVLKVKLPLILTLN